MRVSELKEGMMIRPKQGFYFSVWSAAQYVGDGTYQQLECRRVNHRHRFRRLSGGKLFDSPIIYLGKVARQDKLSASSYEARHEAYVTFAGKKMKVAPEAWRNMEPVSG